MRPDHDEYQRRLAVAIEAARSMADARGVEITPDDIQAIARRVLDELGRYDEAPPPCEDEDGTADLHNDPVR